MQLIEIFLKSLQPGIFSDLKQLTYLILYDNRLTNLSSSLFSGLTSLRVINLGKNNILSIDRLVFVGLLNLQLVYLNSNPISLYLPSIVLSLCQTNPLCVIQI